MATRTNMTAFVSADSLKMVMLTATSYLSRDMRFPTMWYVRPAKTQTSLRIRAV